MKNRKSFQYFISALIFLSATVKTYAVCPVCTVAVAGGVVLAEKYGIDNTITGIWIGGLTVSLIMWTQNWLSNKKYKIKYQEIIVPLVYFLLIPLPLFLMGTIGSPYKMLWGIDKLLLGMIFGSIVFYIGGSSYQYLKAKNNNHAYFPFQKVVQPVLPLIVLSFIFYLITKG